MLKKIISATAAIAVLASVWALSLTPAFAQEPVDEPVVDEVVDEPVVDEVVEEPVDEVIDDYYYDDEYYYDDYEYDWYDDSYDYTWDEYDWYEWEDVGMEDWTEEDYEAYWDSYEWEDDAWEDMAYGYYDIYYEVDYLVWLLDEIDMIYEEYAFAGLEMPLDIAESLTVISEETYKILKNERLGPLYDLARDAIEGSSEYSYEEELYYEDIWAVDYSADVDYLLQAIWDFWDQDPYAMLDYAWEYLDSYYYTWDIYAEIEWMLEDIAIAGTFVDALASLEVDDYDVSWAIEDLVLLIPEAKLALEEMMMTIDQSETEDEYYYMLDLYWEILDEIAMIFYEDMEIVMFYLNEHPEQVEELYMLAPEASDIIFSWMEEPIEPEYDYEEDYEKYYGDIEYEYEEGENFDEVFTETFTEDNREEIIRSVSARLMEELAPYFEDVIAKAILTGVMTYIDIFGEEIANTYLKNQSSILKTLDFDAANAGNLKEEVELLMRRVKSTVTPESYKEELENALKDLRNGVELAVGEDKIAAMIDEITKILDKIDYENIFGANPIEFYDVPFDIDLVWYWDDVSVARNEGIISGYTDEEGNLTGYFKPSNNVTYAEALKMLMEAAGYGPMAATDPVEEPWFQGYLRTLDSLGFARLDSSFTTDWNAVAPRDDILLMSNEISGIQPVDYVEGTFPDISVDDKIADDAMASYLEGIFTGHSETGELKPDDYIDRASFSKVINADLTYLSKTNFVDELGEFRNVLKEKAVGNPEGD